MGFKAARLSQKEEIEFVGQLTTAAAATNAWKVENALHEATGAAASSSVAAYARDGKWLGYDPLFAPEDPAAAASEEELRFYQLSLRGGESYEAWGDPARALDAYV